MLRRTPRSTRTATPVPYTTLFRSSPHQGTVGQGRQQLGRTRAQDPGAYGLFHGGGRRERQGRQFCRRLWTRPQDGRRDVWRCNRISAAATRSEEHTPELQSLMRISYAVFCLQKTKNKQQMYN